MDAFEVLALKGTRKVLELLKTKDRMRYSELVSAIGFSTTTTRALKAMEAARLVDRKVLDEPYRPVAYSLTEKGRKLSQLAAELEKL